MAGNLEVSFNSPQCGWMSVGFRDEDNEFHTTTANSPYENALSELMRILGETLDAKSNDGEWILKWNREPEAFDFHFRRSGDDLTLEIIQYPTERREPSNAETVFVHRGKVGTVVHAFVATLDQLYEDRDTDEFEFNWRHPFPTEEYQNFKVKIDESGV